MANGSAQGEVYRFGDCELRVRTHELLLRGEAVPLEPRVFDLLEFLLRNRERVVSKDELHEAIWTGTYVSEASLSRCVMKARRAVGDDSDSQHTIKTVRGRGYRFVAELDEPKEMVESGSTIEPAVGHRGWRHVPRFQVLLGSAIMALIILAVIFGLRLGNAAGNSAEAVPRVAVLPVEGRTGVAQGQGSWVST